MKKIIVIGSINIDLFITTEQIPKVGETLHGQGFHLFQGGKGANQAVAAARLGAKVSFIGAVGADENGRFALDNLQKEGINTESVRVMPDLPTGVANVISCNGDNSIIVVEGANGAVDDKFITEFENVIKDGDIVLLQNEIPISGVKKAIELANNYGVKVVYNPAPYKDEASDLCKLATYCTPNEIESIGIKNKDNLIITIGEKGVKFNEVIYPANKVSVVDTTGAGDTFNGALCASLSKEDDIEVAIKYGIRASGIAIQKTGAQTGMPYEKEME